MGQTATSFSTRWTGHRAAWKKFATKIDHKKESKTELNEEQALFDHYKKYHQQELKNAKNKLTEAYKITFIEQPTKYHLDIAENYWIAKLKSQINIIKSNFPRCN